MGVIVSKVATYVQFQDERFYRNPVIYGIHELRRWYLCFDDEDPPEVVIERLKGDDPAISRQFVNEAMTHVGIDFKIIRCLQGASGSGYARCFPPDWKSTAKARNFEVAINGPLPVLSVGLKHSGFVSDVVTGGECTFYAWTMKFPTEVIVDLMSKNGKVNKRLAEWVTGIPFYKLKDGEKRQRVRNILLKQYEGMKDLDPEMFFSHFGSEISIRKA